MGGVLVCWNPGLFVQRLGRSPQDSTLLMDEVFRSVEWIQMDHGYLDEEAALERMCARLPKHLHEDARQLVSAWDKPYIPLPEMDALVEDLYNNGYNLYLLSNASLRHPQYWSRLPIAKFFGDRKMISSEWHLLKPEHAFFEKALSLFHLQPEECVFIDDSPSNVEAAVCMGISGIVYNQKADRLRKQLRELGITV